MMKQAWFCPSCQKHHAPHIDTCPAPAPVVAPFVQPVFPHQQPTIPPYVPPIYTTCSGVPSTATTVFAVGTQAIN